MGAKLQAKIYRFAVYAGAVFSVGVLMVIVGYILFKGVPHLKPELFAWEYNSTNVSMTPAIVNTILMTLIALVICVPLGIGAAIWLTEYAKRGSVLVKIVRLTAETLAGIPSIIYGLFGALFFVVADIRRADAFDDGSANRNAHYGGSADGGAGQLSRGLLRSGRGKTAHNVQSGAAQRSSRNSVGCDSRYRAHCR